MNKSYFLNSVYAKKKLSVNLSFILRNKHLVSLYESSERFTVKRRKDLVTCKSI